MTRRHYRAGLYISIFLALTTLATWVPIAHRDGAVAGPSIQIVAVSLLIPIGLWVGSNLIRYVGAALLVVWAGSLIWALFSGSAADDRLVLALLFALSACLCLCLAWLLLLSRKFRSEFSEERRLQPRYKTYMRRGIFYAAIALMIILSISDVYYLTQ